MLKEEANKLAPVWLSMDQLLIEKNEKNEVRSIHSHSRRKSPSLNELLESVAQEKPLSSNETRRAISKQLDSRSARLSSSDRETRGRKLAGNMSNDSNLLIFLTLAAPLA